MNKVRTLLSRVSATGVLFLGGGGGGGGGGGTATSQTKNKMFGELMECQRIKLHACNVPPYSYSILNRIGVENRIRLYIHVVLGVVVVVVVVVMGHH